MILIHIPGYYFKKIESTLTKFLWKGKPPRIALSSLKKDRPNGGLRFPDFKAYHSAFSLKQASRWISMELLVYPPLWIKIEKILIAPFNF